MLVLILMEKIQMIDYENVLVFDLATEGLEPLKHRIVGITCKCVNEERIFADTNEKELLCAFWEYVRSRKFSKLIGYNIDQFDLPMLIIRGLKHGVCMSSIVKNSLDLRKKVFYGSDNHRGKLWEFQELLNIKFPYSRFRKSDMYLMWSTPDIHELQEFLLRDVKVTWALYEHALETGLV